MGWCCLTACGLVALLFHLGEEQVLLGLSGRLPAREGVGQVDAGALVARRRQGRAETVEQHADLQVADDKRRRQDLKAEDAAHGGLLEVVGEQARRRPSRASVAAIVSRTSTK